MKTLHPTEPTQYPEFWNEEWLRVALNELNTRNLSLEDRASFARAIAIKAEGMNAERRRVEDLVRRMLQRAKLSVEEIAEDAQTTVQLVLDIQVELARG
jgi:Na+-transporting NADH:ubiquinone oxidoreductase subunit NqrC